MRSLEGQEEAMYTYCSFIIELAKQEVAQLATGERHSLQMIEVSDIFVPPLHVYFFSIISSHNDNDIR